MAQPLLLTRCPLTTPSLSRKSIINMNSLSSSSHSATKFATKRLLLLQPPSGTRSYHLPLHHKSPRVPTNPTIPQTRVQSQPYQPYQNQHKQHIQIQLYHSTHQPPFPPHEYTNSQTTILSAALAHVPEHGFTRHALTLGARDSGFLDVSVQLFSRAEFDLVLFWLASRRGLLRGWSESEQGGGGGGKSGGEILTVEERIKGLVLERLRMNYEIRGNLSGALALMSLGENLLLSLSELHALSSDILSLAGDTSVDASWYTKRLAVSAIYASAEMYMTTLDRALSEAALDAAIEAFVQRRVHESRSLGSAVDGVCKGLGFLGGSLVGVGRSLGVKV